MSFSRVVSVVFVLLGVGPFLRNRSVREKSMSHCSREVKCQQGDTLHTLGINCSRIAGHSLCL